jgi:hypothetical protein
VAAPRSAVSSLVVHAVTGQCPPQASAAPSTPNPTPIPTNPIACPRTCTHSQQSGLRVHQCQLQLPTSCLCRHARLSQLAVADTHNCQHPERSLCLPPRLKHATADTGAHPASLADRRAASTGALPSVPGCLLKPQPGRPTRKKVRFFLRLLTQHTSGSIWHPVEPSITDTHPCCRLYALHAYAPTTSNTLLTQDWVWRHDPHASAGRPNQSRGCWHTADCTAGTEAWAGVQHSRSVCSAGGKGGGVGRTKAEVAGTLAV